MDVCELRLRPTNRTIEWWPLISGGVPYRVHALNFFLHIEFEYHNNIEHISTYTNMVTTRGGADTASSIASSPATLKPLKKRPAEATEGEQDSPSLTKRKKIAKADSTKTESPVTQKKIAVRSRLVAETPTISTSNEEPTEEPTSALPARNHIRFNSASPPPAIEAPAVIQKPAVVEEEAEESDDDAAPEEVSLSTAKAQSRAVEEKVEQLVKGLSESAKRKRRRRDAQLKAQVEGSTKRKEKKEKQAKTALQPVEEVNNEDEEQTVAKLSKSTKQRQRRKQKEKIEGKTDSKTEEPTVSLLDDIPDLLPAELLATEAPLRQPTPPPSSKAVLSKDAKPFAPFAAMNIPRESAPKDLTYNNVSVRVLGIKNALLPPKVTSRSKSIRDTWLKGRSAFAKTSSRRDTGGKLQRRPMDGATKAFV